MDTLVISPITLSSEIIELSDFVFFTKENPLLLWPVRSFTFWKTIYTKEGWLMLHHNVADYGWAALNQVKRMSQIALSYDYDLFYHMIYDLNIDEEVENEIKKDDKNLIHPRINPRNNNELWEATLHFMIFDRETMYKIVNMIDLDTYLNSNGVAEGQALRWAKEIPLKIVEHPVSDKIYYWEQKDFFNYSKNPKYKFFFNKNTESEIWVGKPSKSDLIDGKLKFVFYDIQEEIMVNLNVNGVENKLNLKESIIFNLDFESTRINQLIINDGESIQDLTKTIQDTNRNLLYYETKFT
jgi:hypothetical protein